MSLRRLSAHTGMTVRQLLRNRVAVALMILVPVVFEVIMIETAGKGTMSFELAAVPESEMVMPPLIPNLRVPPSDRSARVEANARDVGLVFVLTSAVAVVAAFVAFSMMNRHLDATRRLSLCGYSPAELMAGKVIALLGVVAALAAFGSFLLRPFVAVEHPGVVFLGLLLAGWTYASYGLVVGGAVRSELGGVLAIVVLSNVDVAWIQNPGDYAGASNRQLIRSLPGHGPSQVSLIGGFTDYAYGHPAMTAFVYGFLLLLAAFIIFHVRVRIYRPGAPAASR